MWTLPVDLTPANWKQLRSLEKLKADYLLVDERKATSVAKKLGLSITSTLGVLTAAAGRNLLDLPSAIAALRTTTFRAPADMLARIVKADEERRRGQSP